MSSHRVTSSDDGRLEANSAPASPPVPFYPRRDVLYVFSLDQAREALEVLTWCQCWDGERTRGVATVTEAMDFYGCDS
jgi:hypothetical protein